MHAGGRSLARRPAASAESQKTTRQLLRGRRPSALDRQPKSSSCRDPDDLVPRSRPRSRSLSALVNARRFWLPGCWLDLRSGEAQSWQIFAPAKEHGRSMEGLEFHRADCRFRCNLAACPAELAAISPHRLHFRGLLSQALQRQKATLRTLGGSQWGSRTTASSSGRSLKNLRCR